MKTKFVCKSISLANYLLKHNCELIEIDRDRINRDYLVFLFLKNSDLELALKDWNSK